VATDTSTTQPVDDVTEGQEAEDFVPKDVPYEETVKAVKGLFDSQAVTAGAINRLETFVFSITKILKDADILSLERLGFFMDELIKHQTLETFWEVDPSDEPEETAEETSEIPEEEVSTEN
tara:strand:- start:184 stop:546 length:363 start_codon:yes stop_codon:yes gene_type:complete